MNPLLVQLLIKESPEVISFIKYLFHKAHPDEPLPTDAEVKAAEVKAFMLSLATDDAWLAAHPGWNG